MPVVAGVAQGRCSRDRAIATACARVKLLGDADAPILAWAHRELENALSEAEPAVVEKHLLIAIELFERAEETIEIAVTHRALGDLVLAGGHERVALDTYRTGLVALDLHH